MLQTHGGVVRVALLMGLLLTGCAKSKSVTAPVTSVDASARAAGAEPLRATPLAAHTFVPRSDNPYFPLAPGAVFTYRSKTKDGTETEVMRVTDQTKVVNGVTTRVVQDDVRLDGVLTEHTFDYFAMDENGNVWYFGEDSQSIDPDTGEISTEGSWQAGKNGAEAGILMEAHPAVGDFYNEENASPTALDQARVLALDAKANVPFDKFTHCLHTQNTSPLEPGANEEKFYAPGLGLVLEVDTVEKTKNELVRFRSGASRDHRHSEDGGDGRADGGDGGSDSGGRHGNGHRNGRGGDANGGGDNGSD